MRPSDHPYLAGGFAAFAHRGGWVEPAEASLENTLHAFRRAVALGYRHIETDVCATADGELVVFHDTTLDRVSDATGQVGEHTWADLAEVRVGGAEPIPRFAEVLEEFPDTRFNVDLKDEPSVQLLADIVRQYDAGDRVCVASFSESRLRAFRRLAPEVATAASTRGASWVTSAVGPRHWRQDPGIAVQIPVWYRGVPYPLVRRDVIRRAHATGRVVHVWTVNDAAEMHRLIDLGVDGLVSDDITTLKAVLLERELWEAGR
jgi:glycerophosphoryl diester phosphodiesterase